MSLVHGKCIFAEPLQMSHACYPFWKCYKTLFCCFCSLLTKSTIPCACHAKRHLNVQKWSEPLVFHNSVHFFDISTSKSGPNMWCFSHFDFDMCFAPQRHALFRHLNFQKCSEHVVSLNILTSKCASHPNGVHFFNSSTSKSGPNVRCFQLCHLQMCFVPQRRALFQRATSKSGPNMWCFVHFDLEMWCCAPQRRAIFHLSSGQMAPHPPLQRA